MPSSFNRSDFFESFSLSFTKLSGVQPSSPWLSVLRSIAFVSFQMPVYVTTFSHLGFAIALQVITVAEGFDIAAIIGGIDHQFPGHWRGLAGRDPFSGPGGVRIERDKRL
jgi:hypothetical protein